MKHRYVVVDVDGTIADCSERAEKYLNGSKKDWDSFYNHCYDDKPIKPIIDIVKKLNQVYHIVFCSGRRESCRKDTEDWIDLHLHEVIYTDILLRKNGDIRHDTLVKPELLKNFCDKDEVAFILEDRSSMVKKWRELGYTCFQVADGDF